MRTDRTFLRNHFRDAIAIDFAVVSTVTFGLLYVFVVLSFERRRLLHLHVTAHPTAEWTAQQMVEALRRDERQVSDPRSRCDLRNRVSASSRRDESSRGSHCASLPMAECLRGAGSAAFIIDTSGSRPERWPMEFSEATAAREGSSRRRQGHAPTTACACREREKSR